MRNNSFSEILTNTKTEFVFRNNKKTYLEPGNGFQLRYGKFVKMAVPWLPSELHHPSLQEEKAF